MSAPSNTLSPTDFVGALYDAFAKGDAGTVLGALDSNISWSEAEGNPLGQAQPYRGPDAVLNNVFMRLATEWEGFKVAPQRFTAEGQRVVVEGRYTGTCKATGTPIDSQFVHVWTLDNGKITEFQQYTDTAQWQSAMGPDMSAGRHRVVHFEMGAQDPERCAKFFTDVFGWKVMKWEGPAPYWLCMTGPLGGLGINGGILRHKDGAARTINTIQVDSIEDIVDRVKKAGGDLIVPKMAIDGVGWLAYCKDTEGNMFGIMVNDPAAK